MPTILDVAQNIINKLGISSEYGDKLLDLIKSKADMSEIDTVSYEKIQQLLEGDDKILDFERNQLGNYSKRTNQSFNNMKQNLGKLQILLLIKRIEKTKDNDEILRAFIDTLNNKLITINDMMLSTFELKGGGTNDNFYVKYLYYKKKYLKLKELLKI